MIGTNNELKRILLPTDFSAGSAQAFPYAVWFARQFGASITLVYVVPTTLPAELSHIGIVLEEKRLAKEAETTLAKVRARELPSEVAVDNIVLNGGPYYEICKAAGALGIDLIVMSTHGHTGLKHALLGSTAERVVRHAPCSVLTVREPLMPIRFPGDVPCRFKRILVPTDFSAASTEAVRYAALFARLCSAGITLLHVVEPPNYPAWGYAHLSLRDEKLKKKARGKLQTLGSELPSDLATKEVVLTGDAALKIVETAEEQKSDLIVISTHGHTALRRLLLGSVVGEVVRLAPCPVLTIPGPQSATGKSMGTGDTR
jgi:nucleotide-binding universal stress UspA family protein